jgi:hypothetical protein
MIMIAGPVGRYASDGGELFAELELRLANIPVGGWDILRPVNSNPGGDISSSSSGSSESDVL